MRLCLLPSEMKSCYISRPKPHVIFFRIVPAIFLVRNTQLNTAEKHPNERRHIYDVKSIILTFLSPSWFVSFALWFL